MSICIMKSIIYIKVDLYNTKHRKAQEKKDTPSDIGNRNSTGNMASFFFF